MPDIFEQVGGIPSVRKVCLEQGFDACMAEICKQTHTSKGRPVGKLREDIDDAVIANGQQGINVYNHLRTMFQEFGRVLQGNFFGPLAVMPPNYGNGKPIGVKVDPDPQAIKYLTNNKIKAAAEAISKFGLCPDPKGVLSLVGEGAGTKARQPGKRHLRLVKFEALEIQEIGRLATAASSNLVSAASYLSEVMIVSAGRFSTMVENGLKNLLSAAQEIISENAPPSAAKPPQVMAGSLSYCAEFVDDLY